MRLSLVILFVATWDMVFNAGHLEMSGVPLSGAANHMANPDATMPGITTQRTTASPRTAP